jgi:hypothetical protein
MNADFYDAIKRKEKEQLVERNHEDGSEPGKGFFVQSQMPRA